MSKSVRLKRWPRRDRPSSRTNRGILAGLLSGKGLLSILSFWSVGSILSVGSVLSIGSAGSILSIGSADSILSIGGLGSSPRMDSEESGPPEEGR